MIINPYRYAAAPAAGLPPTSLTGLTIWLDADNSAIYKGPSTSDGLATLDNDVARRIDSMNSIARCMADTGPVLKTNQFGSNRAITAASGAGQIGYVKPSGTNPPSSALVTSNLIGAANKVIIFGGRVDSAGADSGNPYQNYPILADNADYCGLFCYQAGGNIVFQAYNFGGADAVVTTTAPAGTPVVITLKQSSNVLRIRKNGTEIASIATANTTQLTGNPHWLDSGGTYYSQLCTCSSSNADAAILEVERYFGARMALSF